jgi:uncharacterized protein YdeI (YjbR/CyaY-like superfamily)
MATEQGHCGGSPAHGERPLLEVHDRAELRAWLAANHATSGPVHLAIGKKGTAVTLLTYQDAIEEALAFGWIDSTAHALDQDRMTIRLARRRSRSTWSRSNKERVERLCAAGLMTAAGSAAVAIAKDNGSWSSLDEVDSGVVPDDLAVALAADPAGSRGWDAASESQRRMWLYDVYSAKRPATRARRVARVVQAAAGDAGQPERL